VGRVRGSRCLFPGNEHLNQVPICAPGDLVLRCLPWTRSLSYGSISQYTVPAGLVCDVLHSGRGDGLAAGSQGGLEEGRLAVAICFVTPWLYGFVHDTRAGESLRIYRTPLRLDEPDRLIAYRSFA